MWMRRWRRRILKRRPHLKPPPGPDPERIREAEQAARDAERLLLETLGRAPEVEAVAARAEGIHKRNNLGPSFWRAMEGRRA